MANNLFRNGALLLCGSLVFVAATGCGAGTVSVSGIVKLQGRPLTSGTVLFHGPDGRVDHSLIAEDGKYIIPESRLGIVRITVQSHAAAPSGLPTRGDPAPGVAPSKRGAAGKVVVLNNRYLDPATSGLTYTVHRGRQTHDIELEP